MLAPDKTFFEIRADGRLFSVGHPSVADAVRTAAMLFPYGFAKIEIIDSRSGVVAKVILPPR
jgi:hypothetical protein